jgi:hypothetical protein
MGANIIRAKIEEIKCKYRVGLLIWISGSKLIVAANMSWSILQCVSVWKYLYLSGRSLKE